MSSTKVKYNFSPLVPQMNLFLIKHAYLKVSHRQIDFQVASFNDSNYTDISTLIKNGDTKYRIYFKINLPPLGHNSYSII